MDMYTNKKYSVSGALSPGYTSFFKEVIAMNEIENLVDESGMITTKNVARNNQSKAEYYNYLKENDFDRFHVAFMPHRIHGSIRY